ncbi:MAG: aspartate aminotransferase family protein [Xanthobacteraceae bacterium]
MSAQPERRTAEACGAGLPAAAELTLDPENWASARELSHRIVDEAIDHLRDVRSRPPWQPMPQDVEAAFAEALPQGPMPLVEVYDEVAARVMAYPMGNIHPRFWAWYMGASNYAGALADFLAAIQGSNLGGGNHAAALLDRQVVDWCKQMMGFPASASGTLVSGGTVANLVGLTVARNVQAGIDVREQGVAAIPRPLRFYGSDQTHGCHRKAVEALGLGNRSLIRIPSDGDCRINLEALRRAIAGDRAAGLQPACIIANAGTVNTGAIDDLPALAQLAREEGLWLHVDGCIGALLALAPENRWRVAGIQQADSLALDPHKGLHAPFEAGCALVRDARSHHAAFAVTPEYLEEKPRGVAAAPWLYDYGPQMSRGFRALKIWMALKQHGVAAFGALIDQNIAQAHHLAERIAAEPLLELAAPASITIVCFRYRPPGLTDEAALQALNVEIMLRLQEDGIAVLSDTTVKGRHCLRVAIANHRTRTGDLDLLVQEVLRIGRTLTEA